MHHEEIDTVPVLWAEAPGPLEATLYFGCGARDETMRTLGVTHLVEHLAMSTLPRLHFEHNASVDLALTAFTCTGRPEQVVDFLARVCAALTDLPLDRIEQEAGVLAAEDGAVADPTTGELLSHRYGATGLGLASYRGPGPDRIPAEAVRDTVRRYFHAGNAVLTLTGPPPAGLRLPLPAGDRPDRTAAQPVLETGPSWRPEHVPGPGIALHGDLQDHALFLATRVLAERLRQSARVRKGLSYDVSGATVWAGPGHGERTLVLDARDGEEKQVTELLWAEALELARTGPTAEELAEEVEAVREAQLDPRSTPHELGEAAGDLLLGGDHQDPGERLAALTAVTPDRARASYAAALATALLVTPCGDVHSLATPDGAPLPRFHCLVDEVPSGGRVFRPPLTARLFSGEARRARLTATERGLWATGPDGKTHHIPFDEVVAVEMHGPGRLVFGVSTCFIPVMPELYGDVAAAVRLIDSAVPERLRYTSSAFRTVDC